MSAPNLPNEVFELVPPFEENKVYGYRLKYKGKFLHPEIIEEVGHGFDIHISPEDFLDFDAALVPERLTFLLVLPEYKCMDLMDILLFEREGDSIKFDYSFSINDKTPPDIYLNPLKLIVRFHELVQEAGYTIVDSEIDMFDIVVHFPAKANLYQHYKKHMDVFEKLMKQAADEMIQKVLGK